MLTYGYNAGLPAGTQTAWGARAIITQDGSVDLLGDRQSTIGEEVAVTALLAKLNGGVNTAWIDRARTLLRDHTMSTRKAEEFTLYTDEEVTVLGNTNASAGYLYVVAYPHEPVACPRCGALRGHKPLPSGQFCPLA